MLNTKTTILRMPITNVFGQGDYSVTLHLGSEKSPVNLLLDTGSSTLVVKSSTYQAVLDKKLTPSTAVQEVNYGVGGWNGPVIYTNINIHEHCHHCEHPQNIAKNPSMNLSDAPVALVHSAKQSKTFGAADGILGLAYHHLNKSFDFSDYFTEHNIHPALSYPWPFSDEVSENLASFKKLMWKYPEHDVTPYFTLLEQQQLSANKFAIYSKRSAININANNTDKTPALELAKDPLNKGLLILGGGEEQNDLYQGEFQSITVEHDVYYNVDLTSVQVGTSNPITAAPLDQKHRKGYLTNAIIDTGAGGIVLTADIYQQVINDLIAYNSNFAQCLAPFKDMSAQLTGIDVSELTLSEWPTLYFNFVGEAATTTSAEIIVQLACKPETYWQINTPNNNKACFRLLSQLPQWPNQSIIGLPLLNNYYVVFDRSVDKTGVVKFAKQKE
ncbi:pepsin-like aspartic protease [Colwellia sp. 12G3]|uniref:pepsin-like aspartic protease n=1 Tax=Colwellia sp. 12G3 TaxID=2058299 RepID=UPI0012FF3312|nr:pepsin-like aspartic protease [Colwellia sp. 12G3]